MQRHGYMWTRAGVRPRLGALAVALVQGRAHEKLGFRSLGDWSRERIGVGARAVAEWARVWRALRELPQLRAAVLAGELSWTFARKIVARATPENEAACLETVRGRSVRAVEAMVEAVRRAEGPAGEREGAEGEERVRVQLPCSSGLATKWAAAVELARRASGEQLSTWEAAEAIAAEAASALGAPEIEEDASAGRRSSRSRCSSAESSECGLRALRWPWLRWDPPSEAQGADEVESDLEEIPPVELDRRFRAAIATSRSAGSSDRSRRARSTASSASRASRTTWWGASISRPGRRGASFGSREPPRRWPLRSARGGSRCSPPRRSCGERPSTRRRCCAGSRSR